VVLPANTLFDDECIRDERSSLGSFFLRHFPTGIDELQRQLRVRAGIANGSQTTASPGTAVLLDKPHGTRHRVTVAAVTTVEQESGIHADTLSIVSAVKKVFKLASQSRISSLTMPVMGTGHGGLDFRAALSLLPVQSVHCMEREGGHEVHELSIVVYNPDAQKRQTIASVVNSVATIFR
jgi:O-acetyl-ADP-ribose deacetylase (regulator of RNase III)